MEAAITWPLIFFSMLAVIMMCFMMQQQVIISEASHRACREAAGVRTETVFYDAGEKNVQRVEDTEDFMKQFFRERSAANGCAVPEHSVDTKFVFLPVFSRMSITVEKTYGGQGGLCQIKRKRQRCVFYSVDEAQLLRNYEFMKELRGKDEKERQTVL